MKTRRLKLFWIVFPSMALLNAVGILTIFWVLGDQYTERQLQQAHADLLKKMPLCESLISNVDWPASFIERVQVLDAVCDENGQKSQTRITIVDPKGRVLGDSEERPQTMDNHADRPEIIEASNSMFGQSVRFSHTRRTDMMYVAKAIYTDSVDPYFLRLSVPMSQIHAANESARQLLLLLVLAQLVVMTVASYLLSSFLTRSLNRMGGAVSRFAEGNLQAVSMRFISREFVELGHGINAMAQELRERIETMQDHEMRMAATQDKVSGALSRVARMHLEVEDANDRLANELEQRHVVEKKLRQANDQLAQQARLDGLTGIPNRRTLDETINAEWNRCRREGRDLSFLICDVDNFKLYNDTYGHQQGDECLREIAQAISNICRRPTDLAARYGGEEFAAIFAETDAAGAMILAERLRQSIEDLQLPHSSSPVGSCVTVSVGVSTVVPCDGLDPAELMTQADTALYKAKSAGRNQVCAENVADKPVSHC